jgi:hypothetical protein
MRTRDSERCVEWNWLAILSYAGALFVSLAAWTGVIRLVQHLVR